LPELYRVKREITEVGRRMYARGMVAANDGNISVRLGGGLFAVTAAGVSKGFLTPDDIVVVDESGRKIEGASRPTSEAKLHLFAYSRRPDVAAVCHAHPPFATAFAVSGRELPPNILPEIILAVGGGIPLTPYATPSTEELARSIEEHLGGADAFLLANHGVLTLGADLTQAYHRLETVEHYARIAWLALSLGGATPLPEGELDRLWCISKGLAPDCREPGGGDEAG
jgi:L-fuculose-phosphate aldolase